jgi:hypothetical protein
MEEREGWSSICTRSTNVVEFSFEAAEGNVSRTLLVWQPIAHRRCGPAWDLGECHVNASKQSLCLC